MKMTEKIWFAGLLVFQTSVSSAQINLSGKVYDESGIFPLESVSVLSNSGRGQATDKNGAYQIIVTQEDSIWFSYLGKVTIKFAVRDVSQIQDFSISIKAPSAYLKGITVYGNNYRLDSINNRIEFTKAFEYKNPTFRSIFTSISITGILVDLDELIRLFHFKKNRKMMAFKKRLIYAEQQKFIKRKFNRNVIQSVVSLSENELQEFITLYSPDFSFTVSANEYEMIEYIKKTFNKFKQR